MRKSLFLIICISLAACVSQPAKESTNQIFIGDGVLENKNTGAAWLSYGLALTTYDNENNGASSNGFEREVYALETTASIWSELRAKGSASEDAELDALAAAVKAGYIKEYIWHFLRNPGWVEPQSMKVGEFKSWLLKNYPNHKGIVNPGVSVQAKS